MFAKILKINQIYYGIEGIMKYNNSITQDKEVLILEYKALVLYVCGALYTI